MSKTNYLEDYMLMDIEYSKIDYTVHIPKNINTVYMVDTRSNEPFKPIYKYIRLNRAGQGGSCNRFSDDDLGGTSDITIEDKKIVSQSLTWFKEELKELKKRIKMTYLI